MTPSQITTPINRLSSAFMLFATLAASADRTSLAGTWVLDTGHSTGSIPQYSALSVGQNSHWFRSAELDKDSGAERTIESECKIDNRFHPVSGGDGGSIRCKWEGEALLSEKHWNNAQNRRISRTKITSGGDLVQDIHTVGPEGETDTHLVWKRNESLH